MNNIDSLQVAHYATCRANKQGVRGRMWEAAQKEMRDGEEESNN